MRAAVNRGCGPDERSRRICGRWAFAAIALGAVQLCGATWLGSAAANPLGGQVVGGSAVITAPNPTELDITQSTERAAINWRSFDIAAGELTRFLQPSSTSVALNRVLAANPSTIAGRLLANGSLVLINPNGVLFAKGSQVNVNSLVATPTDIDTANFMAGRMTFDKPSPNPAATVINQGTITVAQQGLAALVAPGVANSGVIQAKLGKVVLGGAETFTVDLYGDGLISFDVGSKVTTVPIGPGGTPLPSIVSNAGDINAPGGTVLLTADAAAGIVDRVVDMSGRIAAQTLAANRGSVTVDAGPEGSAGISGSIDVSGLSRGQRAGTVTVTGGAVALAGTALIDARGDAGGGSVRIGGGAHGGDAAVPNARTTSIAAGALIDASATGVGAGGTVVVWADQATGFAGTIRANGGPDGGNGGWVETSGGRLRVADTASVSTAAIAGTAGTWLLDPINIDVETSGGTVTPATIVGGLAQGDVVLTADNDITIGATIDASKTGAIGSLSLFAGRNICIGGANCAGLSSGIDILLGGSFTAEANSRAAGIELANRGPGPGSFLMAMGDRIEILPPAAGANPAAAISIAVAPTLGSSFAGSAELGTIVNPSGDITVAAAGDLTTTGPVRAAAGGVTISAQGATTIKQPVSAATSIDLTSNGPLLVAGAIKSGGSVNFATSGDFKLSGPVDAATSVVFTATGAIEIGGAITAASIEIDAGAALAVGATISAKSSVALDAVGDLTANGRISAGTTVLLSAQGALTVGGPITAATSIDMTAAGAIAASGNIASPSLTASSTGVSGGSIGIGAPGNAVATIELSTQSGSILFTDATAFVETGISTPGAASLSATGGGISGSAPIAAGAAVTLTAGGPIALGPVSGAEVSMRAAGPIAAGPVAAPTLTAASTAASGGGITLTDPGNAVATVSLTARSGDIAFADATGFTETGVATPGAVSLGAGGSILGRAAISADGQLTISAAGAIDLGPVSGAGVAVTAAGPIGLGPVAAQTLTASSTAATNGGITLSDAGNAVGTVGLTTQSGNIVFVDSTGFVETGVSTPGTASLSAAGGIGGSGAIAAGKGLMINAAGPLAAGPVAAPTLTASSTAAAGGGITLTSPGNAVATVSLTARSGDIAFADGTGFTETGVSAPGAVSLAAGGSILGGAPVTAGGQLTITAAGPIGLGPVTAQSLTASSTAATNGGIALSDAGNAVATVGLTTVSGNIVFADATGFTETGISTPGTASLTAAGGAIGGGAPITAGGGLTVAASGPIDLGPITAAGLSVTSSGASGGISLAAANQVPGNVALTTQTGDVSFSDAAGFTATGVIAPGEVGISTPALTLAADIAAGHDVVLGSSGALEIGAAGNFAIRAGGNALVSAGGALAVGGISLAAGGNNAVILSANGPLTQTGTVGAGAGIIVLDTTGIGAATVAAALAAHGPGPATASLIDAFAPGKTGNRLQLSGLEAPGSVVLLIAGQGVIAGTLAAAQLGVSGAGGSAALSGSIAGNDTALAALLGVITPGPSSSYLFNNCIIGGITCAPVSPAPPAPPPIPSSALVVPASILAPPTQIGPAAVEPEAASIAVAPLAVGETDALQSGPQAVDPDAPVIDVFDEERLCNQKRGAPAAAGLCR